MKKKKEVSAADGTALFPMPKTALGKACEKFVDAVQAIARAKNDRDELAENVLSEMEKEKRTNLRVTIDNENWEFNIKLSEKKLRCVKVTRQPQPKTSLVDEE